MTNNKQLTTLFQSYNWAELYEQVKDTEYDANIPINQQSNLAIKAMLLVAWWSDNIYSKELLNHFPLMMTEPLTHFAVTYGYICLGDIKKFQLYMSKPPKNYPKWMSSYLDIEISGRNLKFKRQMQIVQKLTSKNQYPKDYIKVAILQSLEHEKADITYLKEYIQNINLTEDDNPLSSLVCLKARIINIDNIDTQAFPILQTRKAKYLFAKSEVLESLKAYDKVAQTKYLDINSINEWLSLAISIPQGKDSLLARVNFAIQLVPNSLFVNGTIASYALIDSFFKKEYQTAYKIVQKYNKYRELPKGKFTKNAQVFFKYILNLCIHWQHNQDLYKVVENVEELHTFGESHTLSLSNINLTLNKQLYNCTSNFIMGIKMYHLSNPNSSHHAKCLIEHIGSIKHEGENLLFSIGEIDTRPDEGIWQVHLKKGKDLDEIIKITVDGYIEFLVINLKNKQLNSVTIQGTPAPNYALVGDKDLEDEEGFLEMIQKVNERMKISTLQQGWNFLDVYSATVGEDKKSNKKYHIDSYHLQPLFYKDADKWLVS